MLFGFLLTLFIINCFFLILFIMLQQGKGGLGALGGSSQMLFGGSGGADFMQKATWVMGSIFLFGSLSLAILRTKQYQTGSLLRQPVSQQMPQLPQPELPAAPTSDATHNN